MSKIDLSELANDYFERFLPFFVNRPEGSLEINIRIDVTDRLKHKLGLAYLFDRVIKLNKSYFERDASLLAYTLFHEMTHLWLYDCVLDPGHTHRFYAKMEEFELTGLPVDADVHIHTRIAQEAKHVYSCPNCSNKWFHRKPLTQAIFCGHCFERSDEMHIAQLISPVTDIRQGKFKKNRLISPHDRKSKDVVGF